MLETKVLRRLREVSREQKLIVDIETSSVKQSTSKVHSKAGTSQNIRYCSRKDAKPKASYSEHSLAHPDFQKISAFRCMFFPPHHKTQPFIFTLAFPAVVHLWVVLEGKMEGRAKINRWNLPLGFLPSWEWRLGKSHCDGIILLSQTKRLSTQS